ncbi:hypothetical protein BC629DRAFT_1084006 [Irpex lacteus]|nr:hypothetical protein BC629DRAFT_1084006 [Irpex lacteus]
MARFVAVSPRACATAALSAVVGTFIAFTVWVFLERDVRDSCSTSALDSVVSWFGFSRSSPSFSCLSTPPLPSPTPGVDASGLATSTLRFITFLGSVPSLVAQGLSQLLAATAYGPSLVHCDNTGSFDLFSCRPSSARLHPSSSLADLAVQHLPALFDESRDSYIRSFKFIFPSAVFILSLKLWLYRAVIPSFKNVPMGSTERWLLPDALQWLAALRLKSSAPLRLLQRHRLAFSVLWVCSSHHLWLSLDHDAPLLSIAITHQLCFKPDIGITHCYDYSVPILSRLADSFSGSLSAACGTPLAWYIASRLAMAVLIGYLMYWHMLIFIVVRAHLLRKAGPFLTAFLSATLIHPPAQVADVSARLDNSISHDNSLEAGQLENTSRTGGTKLSLVYDATIGPVLAYLHNISNAVGAGHLNYSSQSVTNLTDSSSSGSTTGSTCESLLGDVDAHQAETARHVDSCHSAEAASATDDAALLNGQPVQLLASIYSTATGDARQYSHRFPQDHVLSTEFLKDYELTSEELDMDHTGFRLRARSRHSSRCVSVKFLSPDALGSRWIVHPEYGYMPYEAILGKDLDHQNIVSTLAIFIDESGWFYLVQETGIKLIDFIDSVQYKRRRVDLARLIFSQIIAAVYYLDQRGLAHGDLSLDNIIVTEFAEVTLSFYTPYIDDTDIYML